MKKALLYWGVVTLLSLVAGGSTITYGANIVVNITQPSATNITYNAGALVVIKATVYNPTTGGLILNASVTANFGNGDPSKTLTHISSGNYECSWSVQKIAANFPVTVTATKNGESASDNFTATVQCTPLPATPASPNPSDGATLTSQPSKLDWANASSATSYDVYLDGSKVGSNLTSSEWSLNLSLSNGSHSWYVIAKNSCGNKAGPTWRFTLGSSSSQLVLVRQSPSCPVSAEAGDNIDFTLLVKLSSGTAVPGATIVIEDDVKLISTTVTSDSGGHATYRVTPSNSGSYQMTFGPASKTGYTSSGTLGCTINVGGNASFGGKVTDASTSAAIGGATVSWGSYRTTTNSSGNYNFTNLPCSTNMLTVSKTCCYKTYSVSYAPACGGTSSIKNVALTPDETPQPEPSEEIWRITQGTYLETADLDQAVKNEFGPNAVVADWEEIKQKFGDSTSSIKNFCNQSGIPLKARAYVTRNGQHFWCQNCATDENGHVRSRHYLMARFDGYPEQNWTSEYNGSIISNIQNYCLSLGSWFHAYRVLAKIEGGTISPTVSATLSTVEVSPTSVVADGTSTATITVTLRDVDGNPVPGKIVKVYSSPSSSILQPLSPTQSNGQAIALISSTSSFTAVLSAYDFTDNLQLTTHPSIQFTPPPIPPTPDLLETLSDLHSGSVKNFQQIKVSADITEEVGQFFCEKITEDKAKTTMDALINALSFGISSGPIIYHAATGIELGGIQSTDAASRLLAKHPGDPILRMAVRNQGGLYASDGIDFIHDSLLDKFAYYYLIDEMRKFPVGSNLEKLLLKKISVDQVASFLGDNYAACGSGFPQLGQDMRTCAEIHTDAVNGEYIYVTNSIPYLTDIMQQSFADELKLRIKALECYRAEVAQQNWWLSFSKDAKETSDRNAWQLVLLKFGINLMETALLDGVGPLVVSGQSFIFDISQDLKVLESDEMAYSQALATSGLQVDAARRTFETTISGFDRLRQGKTPNPVSGHFGFIHDTSEKNFTFCDSGKCLTEEVRSYSDVEIWNSSESETDAFELIVIWWTDTKPYSLTTATLPQIFRESVVLPPGTKETVHVTYKNQEYGGSPKKNYHIEFYLLGSNETGTFGLDYCPWIWSPDVKILNPDCGDCGRGISSSARSIGSDSITATQDKQDAYPNPIDTYTKWNSSDQTYEAWIFVTNPFESGISCTVTQEVPNDVNVIETDGVLNDRTITWDTTLGVRQISLFKFKFQYPKDPGTKLVLPAATMEFTDIDSGESASTTSNSPTVRVPWKYGKITFDKKTRMTIKDCNGTDVTLKLSGPGYGEIDPCDCNISSIVLYNTTDKSSLAITTKSKAETSVGSIIVNGSLKGISAKNVNLRGDITVDGSLGMLTLNNVAGDHTIKIGSSLNPRAGVIMKFNKVRDLTINSDMPIKSISATEWLGGSINAPSIGSITTKGANKGGITGDLDVNVTAEDSINKVKVAGTLSGNWNCVSVKNISAMDIIGTNLNLSQQPDEKVKVLALGKLIAKCWIDSTQILSTGHIGTITAGAIADSSCFAGVAQGITGLPAAEAASFDNTATIKIIAVKGIKGFSAPYFVNSNIAATNILKASIVYPQSENGGISFGLCADYIKKLTIKKTDGTTTSLTEPDKSQTIDGVEIRLY